MPETAALLATLAAGLWAGASLYIAIAEHPSALRVSVAFATEYFRHMSKRTAPLMMILSALSAGCALYVWWHTDSAGWLTGGLLQLGMFPLTAALIVPTNIRLLKVSIDADLAEAELLHERWARMHWLRTLLGAPAFPLFLWLLAH